MKLILYLLFMINSSIIFGQNWKKIPSTNIMFSNLYDSTFTKWKPDQAEYFKKGEKLIVMNRKYCKQFYDLFSEMPLVFDDILKETYYITLPSPKLSSHYFDSTILNIKFDTASVITEVTVYDRTDAIFWYVMTSRNSDGEFPCKMEILFQKTNTKLEKMKNKYLRTKHINCEI